MIYKGLMIKENGATSSILMIFLNSQLHFLCLTCILCIPCLECLLCVTQGVTCHREIVHRCCTNINYYCDNCNSHSSLRKLSFFRLRTYIILFILHWIIYFALDHCIIAWIIFLIFPGSVTHRCMQLLIKHGLNIKDTVANYAGNYYSRILLR